VHGAKCLEDSVKTVAIQLAIKATYAAVAYADDASKQRSLEIEDARELAQKIGLVTRRAEKLEYNLGDIMKDKGEARNQLERAINGLPKAISVVGSMAARHVVVTQDYVQQADSYSSARNADLKNVNRTLRVQAALREIATPRKWVGKGGLFSIIALAKSVEEDASTLAADLTKKAQLLEQQLETPTERAEFEADNFLDGYGNAMEYTAHTCALLVSQRKNSQEAKALAELVEQVQEFATFIQEIVAFEENTNVTP
jgi:hypothetical protein